MKTAYNGSWVIIPGWWRITSKRWRILPVEELYKISWLVLAKRINTKEDLYNPDALDFLMEHYDIRIETVDELHRRNAVKYSKEAWEERKGWRINCYSKVDKSYVGDPEWAMILYNKGIRSVYNVDKVEQSASNIGFDPKGMVYYAWSQQAIFGFSVGYEVRETDSFAGKYKMGDPDWDKRVWEKEGFPIGYVVPNLKVAERMANLYAKILQKL